MKSKSFALSLNRTDLSAVSGHRLEHGSSRLRQSSVVLPLDLSPLPKQSDSYQGSEIMSRTTAVLERMMWLWMTILAISIIQVVIWSVDRSPPFRVISYQISQQGGMLLMKADVWRDGRRNCAVTIGNSLYDSTGSRFVLEPQIKYPAGAIREIEKKTPGKMLRKLQIPEGVANGPASIVSTMEYECNPLQEMLRPIYVQEVFQFEVHS